MSSWDEYGEPIAVKFEETRPDSIKKYRFIPSMRLLMLLLLCAGAFFSNATFFVLNFTMDCMVNASYLTGNQHSINTGGYTGACGIIQNSSNDSNDYSGTYDWTPSQQSSILAGESYGSILFVFFSGWLLDKYGAHRIFGAANVLLAAATVLIPILAPYGWELVLVTRLLQGIGMLFAWPTLFVVSATWFPQTEFGITLAIASAGFQLGGMAAMSISGAFCSSLGWQGTFYTFGAGTFLFAILWFFIYRDSVENFTHIDVRERNYILAGRSGEMNGNGSEQPDSFRIPWFGILTSIPVWSVIICNLADGYVLYFFTDYIPSYLKLVLGIGSAIESGYISAMPFLVGLISAQVAGPLSDWTETKICPTLSTKLFTVANGIISVIALIAIPFFDCDSAAGAIVMFGAIFFAYGLGIGGYIKAVGFIAPQYAGSIAGLSSTAAYVGGIVAPYTTQYITRDGTVGEWHTCIFITIGVITFGVLVYSVFGSASLQSWANTGGQRERKQDLDVHEKIDVIVLERF